MKRNTHRFRAQTPVVSKRNSHFENTYQIVKSKVNSGVQEHFDHPIYHTAKLNSNSSRVLSVDKLKHIKSELEFRQRAGRRGNYRNTSILQAGCLRIFCEMLLRAGSWNIDKQMILSILHRISYFRDMNHCFTRILMSNMGSIFGQ